MLLSECYALFGGDYEAVRQRICKEEIIQKFLLKFLTEPSFEQLCTELDANHPEEAFRAAHSLKGVSQNLGFDRLSVSAEEMTEYLRNNQQLDMERCNVLLEKVRRDYCEVMEAVRRFAEEQ